MSRWTSNLKAALLCLAVCQIETRADCIPTVGHLPSCGPLSVSFGMWALCKRRGESQAVSYSIYCARAQKMLPMPFVHSCAKTFFCILTFLLTTASKWKKHIVYAYDIWLKACRNDLRRIPYVACVVVVVLCVVRKSLYGQRFTSGTPNPNIHHISYVA